MSTNGFSRKDAAQIEIYERWGCPLDDSTKWKPNGSGDHFTSPDGTGVSAYWLPCVTATGQMEFPNMCASCAVYEAGLTKIGGYPTASALDT